MNPKVPSERLLTAAEAKAADKLMEADYRAGIKTLESIAAEHGMSKQAVAKRAKKAGWQRNLAAKIETRAEAIMQRAEVVATETRLIETNALAIVRVRREHRQDISRFRALTAKIFAELEAVTEGKDILAELPGMVEGGVTADAAKAFWRVVEMPGRVQALEKLSNTLKTLVGLEREAFNLDKIPDDPHDGAGRQIRPIRFVDANRQPVDIDDMAADAVKSGRWGPAPETVQ